MADETGSIEQVKDIEKGEDGVVKRWLMEIEAASKTEKDWRKQARDALGIYRLEEYNNDDFAKRKETFNILWSNTETVRPVLYNSTPRPDIRRRYKDRDPVAKAVAEVCERAVTYTLDCQDFDKPMIAAVNDSLLPGRAITRVRYMPSFNTTDEVDQEGEPTQEVAFEEVIFEQVQYDDFRRGPGKEWDQVPWIAFRHKLTKDQIAERFPGMEDVVRYDATVFTEPNEHDDEPDKEIFKRCLIWEIWEKETRKVIFIATSYKDRALAEKDDPLQLRDFWPIPRPLYAIENPASLVPATKYSMYETLAKELENTTNRIRKILNGLRLRGIYDSRISEIEKLFDSFDNSFIPAENIAALLESGGLDKAIWTLDIRMYADVLANLYEYRQGLIHQIYEITGISDIIRGDTNPNETLGAQQIKANFGSQRLQREQREVQRYARDLVRMTVEIICEHFSDQTLQLMTNLNFPTEEMKQQAQAQMAAQQQMAQAQYQQATLIAQQQGQQVPPFQPPQPDPQVIEMLNTPSWEEIRQIMANDLMRDYRIDIETDSTIQAQAQQDQQSITELITGISAFFASIAEPIASGVVTVEMAKTMLLAAVRRFRLGREVEDALEDIEAPQGMQGVPQEQVQQQLEEAKKQAEQAIKQAQDAAKQEVQGIQQKAGEHEQQVSAKGQEYEARMKQQLADIQKKAADEMAAEKARNKLKEDALALDYKQKIFDLQQQLTEIENKYGDEMRDVREKVSLAERSADESKAADRGDDVNQAVEIYRSVQELKDRQAAEKEKAEAAKPKQPLEISGFDKFMSQLGNLFKASDEKTNKALAAIAKNMQSDREREKEERERQEAVGEVIRELNKPRRIVRDDEGNPVGIE